jgi:hypothetical protein
LFNAGPYCQRSLSILSELENLHHKTHLRELRLGDANAWWRVYTKSRGIGAPIPYEMTLPRGDANLGKFFDRKLPVLVQPPRPNSRPEPFRRAPALLFAGEVA